MGRWGVGPTLLVICPTFVPISCHHQTRENWGKSKFFKKQQVDLASISTHKEEQTNAKDRGASHNSLELFHLVEKICVKQFVNVNEKWEKGNKGGNIQPSSALGMVVSLIYSNLFIPGKHLAQQINENYKNNYEYL